MVRVCCISAADHRTRTSKDQIGILLDQFLRKGLYALGITGGPAVIDRNVAPDRPALLLQPLHERGDQSTCFLITLCKRHQHADPPHPF